MPDFIKNRLALIIVLTIFIICKIPHLYYPYYWDESWVYVPAILLMALHGPSLIPGAINADFSRGHPLFFPALFASWAIVSGHSHFSMHFFALLISSALVIAVYETGLRLFNKRAAVISIVLLVFNIDFFVQSAFVLPDILICLFVILSLYFYATEQYFFTALFLTMLFLTKESGMVLGVVLGADAGLSFLNKNIPKKKCLLKCASVSAPVIVIMVFFIAQKHISGWYMFPGHLSLINLDPGSAIYWLRKCISILFPDHEKYYLFLIVPLLSIAAAIKHHNFRYLFIFLPAIFLIFLNFSFHLTELLSVLLLGLFFSSLGISVFSLGQFKYYSQQPQRKFISLCVFFLIAYLYFSSINFFEARYLFPAIVLMLFLIAVFFDFFISKSYPVLFYPALITLISISLILFHSQKRYSVNEPFSRMDVQQQVVNYLEQHNDYDKSIYCVSDLEEQHLKNPLTGFLKSDSVFKNVSDHLSDTTELAVFDNIELYSKEPYDAIRKDAAFHLIYRASKDSAWAEIYQRR